MSLQQRKANVLFCSIALNQIKQEDFIRLTEKTPPRLMNVQSQERVDHTEFVPCASSGTR
jgi:hypothetical protein